MTTAESPPPAQRWLGIAHLARPWSWIHLAWYGSLFVLLDALGIVPPMWLRSSYLLGGMLVLVIGSTLIAASGAWHLRKNQGNLCLWCAREWPINGAAQADRMRTQLQIVSYHILTGWRISAVWSALGLGLTVWGLLITNAPLFAVGLGLTSIQYWLIGTAEAKHRKFRPWCYVCRDDGGWNGIGGPIGTPDPKIQKVA